MPPVRVAEKNELPSANLGSIQRLESQILFEDEAMIVLNKPSGMAVHGGQRLELWRHRRVARPASGSWFLEPAHRLDRDTSGVLLVAKKRSALRSLHEQLRVKTMRSSTWRWCAVSGSSTSRWSMRCCARTIPQSGERVVRVSSDGKPSEIPFPDCPLICRSDPGGVQPDHRSYPPDPGSYPARRPSHRL